VQPQPEAPKGVLDLFRSTGAYLAGHFRLTSGLHSPEYLQCALVLQHPRYAEELGKQLAQRLAELARPELISVVASPAIGGLIIGHEVARALGVRFIFAERDAGKMTLRRGFELAAGDNAVVVEDVITTGGSTREVVDALRERGARVLAAGSIIDRSGGTAEVGVPRTALETLRVTTYAPESCPLCAQGIPVIKPGSRAV
jgi:orotate phosphoribosyltransferase